LPPSNIDQFLDLIRKCTQLIKDQAADLQRSKRLARLLRRLDLPTIEDKPALLYRLGQIGEIVVPLRAEGGLVTGDRPTAGEGLRHAPSAKNADLHLMPS
jgi:hypothetical protein